MPGPTGRRKPKPTPAVILEKEIRRGRHVVVGSTSLASVLQHTEPAEPVHGPAISAVSHPDVPVCHLSEPLFAG